METEDDASETEDEAETIIRNATRRRKKSDCPWQVVSEKNSPREMPEWRGSLPRSNNVRRPIDYFRDFFDDKILDFIVEQTNLYSVQRNPNKPLNLDRNELEQFLGSLLFMSLLKISNVRLYWSAEMEFATISNVFTRSRWEEIKSCLHCNDNTNQPNRDDPNRDRLFKIRPLITHMQEKFRKIPMAQNTCVDEMLVPYKGLSYIKQYIPTKPYKWGFKLFALCETSGILHDFDIYDGPIKPVPGEPDLGASSNIVLQLAKSIPVGLNHILFHDNWFTSPKLMSHLAKREIHSIGTVRQNRLKGASLVMPADKDMMKKARGSHIELETDFEGAELRAVKWYDNRCVTLLSSFSSAEPLGACSRYDKKQKKLIQLPCPDMVRVYNKGMGGVDLMDALVALYRIHVRSHKYYHKLIFHFFDVAVVNAWLLYRRDADHLGVRKNMQLQLQSFKLNIANVLLRQGKCVSSTSRPGRPRSTSLDYEHKKKKATCHGLKPIPAPEIRKDKIDHFVMVYQEGERPCCKLPGCGKRSSYYCKKCNVALCLTKDHNCFYEFHHRN